MKAIFPGTFDPPTLGHIDIIQRAAHVCTKLIVAIPATSSKTTSLFTPQERVKLLELICISITNIQVEIFHGLLVDYCKEKEIDLIVRGLRTCGDLDFELQMAQANRTMSGVETWFVPANPHLSYISSTLIREIAHSGQHLEDFLPEKIYEAVYAKVKEHKLN